MVKCVTETPMTQMLTNVHELINKKEPVMNVTLPLVIESWLHRAKLICNIPDSVLTGPIFTSMTFITISFVHSYFFFDASKIKIRVNSVKKSYKN